MKNIICFLIYAITKTLIRFGESCIKSAEEIQLVVDKEKRDFEDFLEQSRNL